MNFGAILFRFVLLITVLSALVSCQQEPEPDSPGITELVSTSTIEPTQQPPTAAISTATTQVLVTTPEPTKTPIVEATPMPTVSPTTEPSNNSDPRDELLDLRIEADSAFVAGDYEQALVLNNQMVELAEDMELGPLTISTYIFRGDTYAKLKNYEAAIADYLRATESDDIEPSVLNNLCWWYGLTEQPEEALPYCEEAVNLNPSAAYMDSRGLAYGLLGDYESAIVDFEAVISDLENTTDPELSAIAAQRAEWVAAMEAGENPFTADQMAILRGEETPEPTDEPPADEAVSDEFLTYRITFVAEQDGNSDIYAMNADGTHVTHLVDHPAQDEFPLWSPDGQHLAFISNRYGGNEIFLLDVDGSDLTRLTEGHNVTFLTWSPDSQSLAFSSIQDGDLNIYVLDLEGGEPRAIANSKDMELMPNWSPNGDKITYITVMDQKGTLNSISPDGSDRETLFETSTIAMYLPQWSPNSEKIAFTGDIDGIGDIYLYDTVTRQVTNLTESQTADNIDLGAWSQDGQKIVFYRLDLDEKNTDIYVLDVTSNEAVQITDSPGLDTVPIFSPDGQSIIFVTEREEYSGEVGMAPFTLYIMDADGSNQQKIFGDMEIKQYVWSPLMPPLTEQIAQQAIDDQVHGAAQPPLPEDGLIAFFSDRDENMEIYLAAPDGGELTRLTNNDMHDVMPVWSPDGTRLLVTRFRTGDSEYYTETSNLIVLDRTGTAELPVTFSAGTFGSYTNMEPKWSPDSQYIAFMSTQAGLPDMYVMNAYGAERLRLTEMPLEVDMMGENFPSSRGWSSDGEWVSFVSTRNGNRDIYIIRRDGTELTQLTNDPDDDNFPSWSPDGQWIVFNRGSDLFMVKWDGSEEVQLTDAEGANFNPVWSPDSRSIAFQSDRDGNIEIYILDLANNEVFRLTNDVAVDSQPVWSPDGNRLAFYSDRDGNGEIFVVDRDGINFTNITNNPAEDMFPAWSP